MKKNFYKVKACMSSGIVLIFFPSKCVDLIKNLSTFHTNNALSNDVIPLSQNHCQLVFNMETKNMTT